MALVAALILLRAWPTSKLDDAPLDQTLSPGTVKDESGDPALPEQQ